METLKEEEPEEEPRGILRRTAEYVTPLSWRTWLIGRPLATADAPHQTIGKAIGLAVFSSDALSSTAYATQEILVVLAAAGTAAFTFAFPISLAIVVLLTIVTLSYEQTIHAYPGGGGAYIVARDNLGELPAQTAGAALLTDYILTVAVSVSSGVAQVTSAFPSLFPYRVHLSVGLVLFITIINLRGVKESGVTFATPTYFFLMMMFLTVGIALFRCLKGTLGTVACPSPAGDDPCRTADLSLLDLAGLLQWNHGPYRRGSHLQRYHRFQRASQPECRHYSALDVSHSGNVFSGNHVSGGKIGALPSEQETVISQLARTAYRGPDSCICSPSLDHSDPDYGGQYLLRRLSLASALSWARMAFCPDN